MPADPVTPAESALLPRCSTRTVESRDVPYEFGVLDAKARAIGANVRLWTCEYVEAPESTIYRRRRPGLTYCYAIQSTRNHRHFGAGGPRVEFATLAERDAAAARAVQLSFRRVARNYAGAKLTGARS